MRNVTRKYPDPNQGIFASCRHTFHPRLKTYLENLASHGGGPAPLPPEPPTLDVRPQPSPWHSTQSVTPHPPYPGDAERAKERATTDGGLPSPLWALLLPLRGAEERRATLSSMAKSAVLGRRHRRQSTKSRVNTERASSSKAVVVAQHFDEEEAAFALLLLQLLRAELPAFAPFPFCQRSEWCVNLRWVRNISTFVLAVSLRSQ